MSPRKAVSSQLDEQQASGMEQKGERFSSAVADSSPGFPVVGIGASAGGLEAFIALFKAILPDLGMAYVLVPHLDPLRESAIAQIVSRATPMPVLQIEDGMDIRPDHVYVIPPNCDLVLDQSRFRIGDREQSRAVNATIDIFFRSLAEQGSNAIGIVLSGSASDGTQGLSAIKGEGGITFAQDTESAKYDSMPASAVAAGCVDFVLPPEGIANELARIRRHPLLARPARPDIDNEEHSGDSNMAQVFRLLRRATRVDFSGYKPATISRRIQRRMVLHKIEKLGDYVALLHRDRNEIQSLYQDLLINVTSFFRNPEAFESLKEVVYPAILQSRNPSVSIRIWVPGCSTGEEAYSHAISLVEFLDEQRIEVPIQIFGTDLSASAVHRARSAVFREGIEADVSPARLRRFFHKSDGGYQISKTIRDLCIFSTQNIFSDPPLSRMDLVSCRNVMIYLGQPLQKRVIPIFHYALNPAGFLMIGNSEGLLGAASDLFEMVEKKQKIYRRKGATSSGAFGFVMSAPAPDGEASEPGAFRPLQPEPSRPPVNVNREADRLLLSRYAPPSVVVDERLEILQSRGSTGHFLELAPGRASLNLLMMIRPGLLSEVQSAIEEAKRTGLEAERHNLRIQSDGVEQAATVRVVPFRIPVQERVNYLVIFDPEPSGAPAEDGDAVPLTESERAEKEKQIEQLRQELSATRDYLHSIIEMQEATNEELQSANEEIQSGNEELQSTNEELQTSKEELESANEELHTVNEEMQHRNDLLNQLNNDLTNFLNSVNLPMVMVSSDLSVRRYTPQATGALGLMPSDVGRPLPRLRLKVDAKILEQAIVEVMQEVRPNYQQVQNNEGRWFSMRITPYRTLDNRIDGAVLTIVDRNPVEEFEGDGSGDRKAKPSPVMKKKKSAGNKKR